MASGRSNGAAALCALSLLIVLVAARGSEAACNETCRRDLARCMATQCEGVGRAACRRRCKPARIRTLAYVLSECREDVAGSWVAHQSLRIRRGDLEPITVAEFGSSSPRDVLGACRRFGENRSGQYSVLAGGLQRLGVSPDGATVVFEVNDEFSLQPPTLAPEEKGFFLVRADGSEPPRRLGPPSRDMSFRGSGPSFSPPMLFSPNGRLTAYTDIGSGPNGEDAVQIVVHDLVHNRRTQVTRLPFVPEDTETYPFFRTCCPRFVDNNTVLFQTFADADGLNPQHDFAAFTVRVDGSNLTRLPPPVVGTDSKVVPSFSVFGPGVNLIRLAVPGIPKVPAQSGQFYPITELYLQHGKQMVQLTNFELVDTFPGFVNSGGTRAFFLASADPGKENPNRNCQIFSTDQFAHKIRQVTHFEQGGFVPVPGCFTSGSTRAGCGVGGTSYYRVILQDPVTKVLVYESSCDPVGANPRGGQIFAMRPDGSGFRQLTEASGFVTETDGSFSVQLPGPFAYSAPLR
jgi:hypothetical protein